LKSQRQGKTQKKKKGKTSKRFLQGGTEPRTIYMAEKGEGRNNPSQKNPKTVKKNKMVLQRQGPILKT